MSALAAVSPKRHKGPCRTATARPLGYCCCTPWRLLHHIQACRLTHSTEQVPGSKRRPWTACVCTPRMIAFTSWFEELSQHSGLVTATHKLSAWFQFMQLQFITHAAWYARITPKALARAAGTLQHSIDWLAAPSNTPQHKPVAHSAPAVVLGPPLGRSAQRRHQRIVCAEPQKCWCRSGTGS
jgi:hypothetical protein